MLHRAYTLFAALFLLGAAVFAQESSVLTITPLGTYTHGGYDEGASEISAYHAASRTLYVVNAGADAIDMLDISDPSAPALKGSIDLEGIGSPNSVAVYGDIVAVAAANDQEPGVVAFYSVDGALISQVTVGALPDMLTFTPDGSRVVTANEGEPSDDYSVDPEGSVSIVDVSAGVENATVTTVSFADAALDPAINIYGPNATPAQDLEPEYVAISADSSTAYVIAQENNALLVIDLASGTLSASFWLGTKDLSQPGSGFDGGKDDGVINIANWPVQALYRPDAIVFVNAPDGTPYLITANEGDTRDYDGYSEEGELGETPLDAAAYPNADELAAESAIGGLEILTSVGDADGDGDIDQMHISGARSFSVWNADGSLAWDSGDQLERLIAELLPEEFNSTNEENGSFDDRSDNAGPEPEGLAVGTINGVQYLFVGLERIGGFVVYDLTTLPQPTYVTYVNNRDFEGDAEAGTAGDLGPEGLTFISAEESPNGAALLVLTNEISGTTTIFEIR
jgi:hypothetical protein